MSEKEKATLLDLAESVSKLPKDKQQYILGLADGMALNAEERKANELKKE